MDAVIKQQQLGRVKQKRPTYKKVSRRK